MTTVARRTGIIVSGLVPMLLVHRGLIVLMTTNAREDLILCGSWVALRAGRPFVIMLA